MSIDYIGSKKKLSNWILDNISECYNPELLNLNDCKFGDLFAGSGVVSLEAQKRGAKCICNDIQEYSKVWCNALLNLTSEIYEEYMSIILGISFLNNENENFTKNKDFFYKTYSPGSGDGSSYFTSYNAKKIDTLREIINEVPEGILRDSCLASLMTSCNAVMNTASVQQAYLKEFKQRATNPLFLLNHTLPVNKNKNRAEVLCKNTTDILKEKTFDIVYLDPPYNWRQYSSNFHIFETIAKEDFPLVHGKTKQRNDNFNSNFCYKGKAVQEFKDILQLIKSKWVFISYNNKGIVSMEQWEDILSEYNWKVLSIPHKILKTHKSDNDSTIEYLFVIDLRNIFNK